MNNSCAKQLKVLGVAAASSIVLATVAPAAHADPVATTAGTVSARTDPAVVLVETDVTATIRVAQPELNQAAVDRLTATVIGRLADGDVGSDRASVMAEILRLVEKNPDAYFTAGKVDSIPSRISGYGTGFIVTPDGYVVTAAHVVAPDQTEIRRQFAEYGLQREAQQVAANNRDLFAELDDAQTKAYTDAILGWQSRHMSLVDQRTTQSAQLGIAVAGFDKTAKGVPVTLIAAGKAYPGRDVAILKLGGNTTAYPTVPVGTDADVRQGDTVYVDGYPAASTFYAETSKDSQLQPSTTSGQITAVKTTDQGTAILQSQAPITPGNSGGPVLDGQGRVVGLVSAAAVDSGTGTQAQGQNFFIAASVIGSVLNEHNVTPSMSLTSLSYNQAVADFGRQHFKPALTGFQKAQNLYPGHPYAGHFISDSQAAISAGRDRTPAPFPWLPAGAVGAGVLALLGAGTALVRRRRRGRSGAPAAPATSLPSATTAYPGPNGWWTPQGQPGGVTQPAATGPAPMAMAGPAAPPMTAPPMTAPPMAAPPVVTPSAPQASGQWGWQPPRI